MSAYGVNRDIRRSDRLFYLKYDLIPTKICILIFFEIGKMTEYFY